MYKNDKNLIIVVSAMGKTTDNLIEMVKPFDATSKSKRELDVLLSSGETISASIFSIILNHCGVPAKSFQAWQVKINTMGDYQNSLITSIDKANIEECLSQNFVAVVTGFQGINKLNETTTLGRGGSDTTAAALGATFQCNVELYSDFNGVFACDPRHCKSKKLSLASLEQLDFASKTGSRVISNRAVKIAKNSNISFIFKSSAAPHLKGTNSSLIENNKTTIQINPNLCEVFINNSDEKKIKLIAKNVIFWLKNYKIYNLTIKFNYINLLVNQSDKSEILNILTKKLNL